MKRFTLILSLMVAMVTTAMAQIDVTKTYRIKDVASGEYLTAFNHDTHSGGTNGGVGVAAPDENSKEQVFYLEQTSNGYLLRLASGDYYVVGWGWNVDAIKQNGTIFNFEDAGEGKVYLKKGGSYFKIQDLSGTKYVFCDNPGELKATWELEVAGESGYATYNTFNANKAYVIKTRERGGLTINADATAFCSTNDAGRGKFVEHANTDNHFAVVTYDEKSYLYSVKAKKFLKADKSLTEGIGDAVAFRDAKAEGASRMSIYFKDVADANINIGGDNEIQVNWWSPVDHGNAMLFIEVADFNPAEALEVFNKVATITYEYQLNGKTLAIQKATANKGEAYPELIVPELPLGVVVTGAKPAGNVTANATVQIALGVDNSKVPFTFVTEGTPTKWYYAQMHAYGGYHWFVAPAADGASVETQDHKFAADETDAHLWGFVGTVEGGFKMVNKATKEAIKSNNDGIAAMASVADATAFTVMPSPTNGWFCLRHPEGNYLNSQGSGALNDFVIKHWNDNDNGSSFFLTEYVDEDVTVNVSELGWATKYFGESVYVPAGVNAYIITGAADGYVTKEQIAEGEVIPANTGVLLENAGEYDFAKTVSYNYTLAGNLLNGSVENTYVEGEAYVLANHNEAGLGFYMAELNKDKDGNEGTTHFLNNAGKAYLVLPTASETVAFYGLDWDGTTGIENVEVENEVKAIYDLTGRRVEAITAPGIYIVNGKKVLVK